MKKTVYLETSKQGVNRATQLNSISILSDSLELFVHYEV